MKGWKINRILRCTTIAGKSIPVLTDDIAGYAQDRNGGQFVFNFATLKFDKFTGTLKAEHKAKLGQWKRIKK